MNAITKDTWELFYELIEQTNGDLNKFEDDGEKPVLFDQFFTYVSVEILFNTEQ